MPYIDQQHNQYPEKPPNLSILFLSCNEIADLQVICPVFFRIWNI